MSDVFIAFSHDPDCLETIKQMAQEHGLETNCVHHGGVGDFLAWSQMLPPFAVIDVSDQSDPLAAVNDMDAAYGDNTQIIVIGQDDSAGSTTRMREAGAKAYLTKPLDPEELRASLELDSGDDSGDNSRIIKTKPQSSSLVTFIGARGGVGASTLAVNYAFAIAHDEAREKPAQEKSAQEKPAQVLVIDFDLEYGCVGLQLNLDSGGALRTALENPERIDSHFLSGAFSEYSHSLSIMSADIQIGEDIDLVEDAVETLISELRGQFTHIICDLPRYRLLDFPEAAINADEIFIVSDLSMIGLRDTIRVRAALERSGCKATIKIVTNAPTGAPGQVEHDQFSRALGIPIHFSVPHEASAVSRALNVGKPLAMVAPHAHILPVLQRMIGHDVTTKPETILEKASRWLMGD